MIKALLFVLLSLAGMEEGFASPILAYEFDWTAQSGYGQYDATILYSGGFISDGVFTPTGLTTFSFGTPFGTITPSTHYPGFGFVTDTQYGPSFQAQGTIEPMNYAGNPINPGYQLFIGNNLALYFQADAEIINYFDTKQEPNISLTGTWTETIITAPDGGSSLLLLALALGGIAAFHFYRSSKLA